MQQAWHRLVVDRGGRELGEARRAQGVREDAQNRAKEQFTDLEAVGPAAIRCL